MSAAMQAAAQNLWTIEYDGGRDLGADVEAWRVALYEEGGAISLYIDSLDQFLQGSLRAWNVALRELQNRDTIPEVWEYVQTVQFTLLAVYRATGNSGAPTSMPEAVEDAYNAILAS
jgi:hypothetical protein